MKKGVDEDDVGEPEGNEHYQKVKAHAESEGSEIVAVSGKVESELVELPDEDRAEMLEAIGLSEPGLYRVIRGGYSLLGLQTFFTAGEKEVRAWTFQQGWKAPQTAGVIHSDFERGFIRVEVYSLNNLEEYKSEKEIRAAGKLRIEGKGYLMQDGDICHFLFNV